MREEGQGKGWDKEVYILEGLLMIAIFLFWSSSFERPPPPTTSKIKIKKVMVLSTDSKVDLHIMTYIN